MVSNSLELRPVSSIRSEEQFLKHNRVYGETDAAFGLSGEQLRRRRFPLKVSNDNVRVQEHERSRAIRTFTPFDWPGFRHLFHLCNCRRNRFWDAERGSTPQLFLLLA